MFENEKVEMDALFDKIITTTKDRTMKSFDNGCALYDRLKKDGFPVTYNQAGTCRIQIGKDQISIACPFDLGGKQIETLPINENGEFFIDDYMTRPDSYEELTAYIGAVIKLGKIPTFEEYLQIITDNKK